MSVKYGQFCPIAKAAEVLGERWTLLIIRELLLGTSRFVDFQRSLSQISPSLLSKRLNQLVDDELVIRKKGAGQQRGEYFLTAAGRELEPIVLGLGEWGARWARGQMSDEELDVELLMYDLCRRLELDKIPAGTTVLRFVFPGLTTFGIWWIVVEGGAKELCVDNPKRPVDVTLTTDVRTLTEIWAGDTKVGEARAANRLRVEGAPALVRTIRDWMPTGLLSKTRPAERTG